MIRRSIEARLQNIIDLDTVKNKQLAIKTKLLNNKLQQYERTIEKKQLDYFEKTQIYEETTEIVNEHEELWESVLKEITRLKQHIYRLQKSADMTTYTTSCRLTDFDRNVHVKRELKQRVLNHFTKLFLVAKKSPDRFLGYVTKGNELNPFEIKCNPSQCSASNAEDLWQRICGASDHQNEWDELLFADEASDSYKNATL